MPAPVNANDQEVPVVERRLEGPAPSDGETLLKLELRSRMLEIDKRIAMLQAEEYRRLLLSAAVLGGGGGGGGGELSPAAALAEPLGLPEPRRCPASLPAAAPTGGPSGSSSQALVAQAARWPLGPPSAVAAATTGPRQSDVVPPQPPQVPVASGPGATPTTGSCQPALPSTLPPLSSQLDAGDVSGRSTRGRGRGRGRGRTGYANVATSSTRTRSRLVCNYSGLLDWSGLAYQLDKTDAGPQGHTPDRVYANKTRATAPTSIRVSRECGEGREDGSRSGYPASVSTATTISSSPVTLYVCFRDGLVKVLFSPPHSRARFQFSLASAYRDPVSLSAHRTSSNRFCSRAAVELFIRENGVEATSSLLTPQDAALVVATPDLLQKRFTALFGGNPEHERPNSHERNIICINSVAQPYAPRSPGESGLLFFAPGVVRFEDNYPSFHVFVNMSPPKTPARERIYRYFGTYTKVPTIRTTVEVDEWLSLPIRVSRSFIINSHAQCSWCLPNLSVNPSLRLF